MNISAMVAEIGSTVTSVSAFDGMDTCHPHFLGQGHAPTSVGEGDVRTGLDAAVLELEKLLGERINAETFMASSSAAGGLRMTVHGLVKDMTVRAAREAALGAGANINMVTSGRLRDSDITEIHSINPNIIMIAGGVDYGERDTALHNAAILAKKGPCCPIVYAGNIQAAKEIFNLFKEAGRHITLVNNVYPAIDRLEVEPARVAIHNVFEEHITNAPGMEYIRERVDGRVIPTPGAVMDAAVLLHKSRGNLVVLDVGGATTDIHAVCNDSEEFSRMMIAPEPVARRTVEGDLGTYVSRRTTLRAAADSMLRISASSGISETDLVVDIETLPPIPFTRRQKTLAGALAEESGRLALTRHAGRFRDLYGPSGRTRIAEGKDLSAVGLVVATGGALTKLPCRTERIQRILEHQSPDTMTPSARTEKAFDNDYIMASAGILSAKWPGSALALIEKSLWPDMSEATR